MLGGSKVNISGPCASSQYTIKAQIVGTNISVNCQPVGGNVSSCIFPPIFQTGEMTIEYSPYDNTQSFSGTYVISKYWQLQLQFELEQWKPIIEK